MLTTLSFMPEFIELMGMPGAGWLWACTAIGASAEKKSIAAALYKYFHMSFTGMGFRQED